MVNRIIYQSFCLDHWFAVTNVRPNYFFKYLSFRTLDRKPTQVIVIFLLQQLPLKSMVHLKFLDRVFVMFFVCCASVSSGFAMNRLFKSLGSHFSDQGESFLEHVGFSQGVNVCFIRLLSVIFAYDEYHVSNIHAGFLFYSHLLLIMRRHLFL